MSISANVELLSLVPCTQVIVSDSKKMEATAEMVSSVERVSLTVESPEELTVESPEELAARLQEEFIAGCSLFDQLQEVVEDFGADVVDNDNDKQYVEEKTPRVTVKTPRVTVQSTSLQIAAANKCCLITTCCLTVVSLSVAVTVALLESGIFH